MKKSKNKKSCTVRLSGSNGNKMTFIIIFWAIAAITSFILSKPHDLIFGIITVIMFTAFGTAFTHLIIEDIIKPFSDLKKRHDWSGKILPLFLLKSGGIFFLITGMGAFANGFFAAAGITPWTTEQTEIPLTMVGNHIMDKEGRLYCTLNFYCRIQVYDSSEKFIRGWFINSGGGRLCIKIDEENRIIVANIKLHKILTFTSDGKMIKEEAIEGNEYEKWYFKDEKSDRTIKNIQNKIPLYTWFLFGPQCWLVAITGLLVTGLADREIEKIKKSHRP